MCIYRSCRESVAVVGSSWKIQAFQVFCLIELGAARVRAALKQQSVLFRGINFHNININGRVLLGRGCLFSNTEFNVFGVVV